MSRWIGLLVVMLTVHPAATQEKEKPTPLQIRWYGQSFFTLTSSTGKVLAFDPHMIPDFGRNMGLKADVVLISHLHNDHTQVGVFENAKEAQILMGLKGGSQKNAEWNRIAEEAKGFQIRSVGTYHDGQEGLKYGKNTCFVVEVDGWKIAHLGDLGHTLSEDQVKKIGPVDVLMIPVGGIYALNGSEAKEVVAQLKPKEYIFPMHLGTKVYNTLLPVDEFLEEQERAKIAHVDDNMVELNKQPDRPKPLIVLLGHAPKGK